MSANEKQDSANRKERYSSPEIVRLGDVVELTEGGGDPLSDGYSNPKTYKDAPGGEPASAPTKPPA